MDFIEIVGAVPEGIWGVLLGSLLAFGGTFVATRQQLRHDAEQRERERKMQLRREVFLESADGVAGNAEYFMKFANVDLPISELTPSNAKPGWLNKLYTVASLDAIEAFTVANAALGAAAFDLLRRRLVVEDVKNKITSVSQQIDAIKAIQQTIRDAVAATANVTPTPEVLQGRKVVQQHWDQTWREFEKLGEKNSHLLDQKVKLQRVLLEQAISYSIEYQKKLRKALVALRLELDLPIDETRLETFMAQVDAEMLPKMKELFDAIESDADASVTFDETSP